VYYGEVALQDQGAIVATFKANAACDLSKFDLEEPKLLIRPDSDVMWISHDDLNWSMNTHKLHDDQSYFTYFTHHPFFKELGPDRLQLLANHGFPQFCSENDIIYNIGQNPSKFYVIIDGSIRREVQLTVEHANIWPMVHDRRRNHIRRAIVRGTKKSSRGKWCTPHF
jgi:hypothetical protein